MIKVWGSMGLGGLSKRKVHDGIGFLVCYETIFYS